MLNSSEDAHVKAMSAFETDEHLREQVCVAAEVARLHSMSEGAPGPRGARGYDALRASHQVAVHDGSQSKVFRMNGL